MAMEATAEHLSPRRYRVVHQTSYDYDEPVTTCYERGFLAPRETPSQTVVESALRISPEPAFVAEHRDYFGNLSHYVEVPTDHHHLEITKDFVVDVAWPAASVASLNQWSVAQARSLIQDDPAQRVQAQLYRLRSPKVQPSDAVVDYARDVIGDDRMHGDDRGLGDVFSDLTLGIYRDFAYRPGVTTTRTTLAELMELRAGVCQDFAHLAVGCLRLFGLPARYVSGYIETTPPPGKPKLAGSDASHAWASVLTPDGSWVDVDPTNAHFADSRYVVNGWGRDFGDVSPLKGVISTEATSSSLRVGVDVIRVVTSNLS